MSEMVERVAQEIERMIAAGGLTKARYRTVARAAIEATAAHLRAEGLPEIAGIIAANLKEPAKAD